MYTSKKPYMYGTGRRKSSVARVRLFPNGTGAITINGRDIDDYFGLETLKMVVRQPMVSTDTLGKVDIVAWDGGELVFVKVRTRTSIERGFPSERVTPQQRGRAEKMASYFLSDFDAVDIPVRFDVVALMVVSEDRAFVRHYRNAFNF